MVVPLLCLVACVIADCVWFVFFKLYKKRRDKFGLVIGN